MTDPREKTERGADRSLLVAAYYTVGTPYSREAAGLQATLDRWSLPCVLAGVPSLGSWHANTRHKAAFAADCLRRYGADHRLLILDADARVEADPRPALEALDCDFAAHWYRDRELISATLYLPELLAGTALVARWRRELAARCDWNDQRCLQAAVESSATWWAGGLRVVRLGPEWNWIEADDGGPDLSERVYGRRAPIIRQTQASRRWKLAVDRPQEAVA